MKTTATLILTVALGLVGVAVHAGYVGPQAKADTVQEVLDNARAYDAQERDVRLIGRITKQLSPDRFEFTDATGAIRIEIDPEDFPLAPIDETTNVEIMGEVEAEFLKTPEIEVQIIRILPPDPEQPAKPVPEEPAPQS